ncbi:Uncharacterized conserved protein, DUF362 family [Malonomonas rubra DSM 5091]|uniref:Uncharacterized conserved protein, DUF362 family n=1 Tax=Malonomonas rubra DSM 5091 TaxID=1122189 RepID=A0A1M6G9E4_MALRU|nr:DUF362 domain-containing protein [Malonomonas rubra]SHJ06532.1 Uncharacterized conserved protein, DUF362 family [Malonomonas rubra DSM 5091]
MTDLNRRQFIRSALHSALAVGTLPVVDLLALPAHAATAPQVALRTGKDYSLLVEQTLSALGGIENFVGRGDRVVVKPNIGWDRTPEQAANTHPEVVKAVIEHCLQAGAKQVQVFDNTCNDPRRCYVQSGIQDAVKSLRSDRAKIGHMDRYGYQDIAIEQGRELDRWKFYQPALDADKFINIPVAKDHSSTTLSLAMKNIMGVIGGNRGRLHRRIDEAVADINLVVHSDLSIIDATRILLRNGPQGGRLEDVERRDTLIASADIVAADSMAAGLFNLQPDDISTVVAGARRGLGVMDLGKVQRV